MLGTEGYSVTKLSPAVIIFIFAVLLQMVSFFSVKFTLHFKVLIQLKFDASLTLFCILCGQHPLEPYLVKITFSRPVSL